MTRLTTLADAGAVATRAAEEIARLLQRALQRRGVAHLALSGGTTPRRTYQLLAQEAVLQQHVHLWFADERCVPPDDQDSNHLLAEQTLLRPARVPAERVHRMLGELGPHAGAARYAQELLHVVRVQEDADVPQLDVVVLGVGPDGHVASLFPGALTLRAPHDAVCLGVTDSPKPPPQRITLSLPMLHAARRCVLLATGPGKADAISAAVGPESAHVPASLLCRERLTAIVDDAAAPAAPIR
ncbi:MAG: 6-phosphogluconolactonase [Solirubrobacteraceae bacterium]